MHLALPCIALAAMAGLSRGDIIYQTNTPYFGPSGPPAFGLTDEQAVALRFTPDRDYTLDAIRVWIISDNFEVISHAPVRVQLRTSHPTLPRPTSTVIEEMAFEVETLGWAPLLQSVESRDHPLLRAGIDYWIILECDLHEGAPGWSWADGSTGMVALSYNGQATFNDGGIGAVTATTIEGTPACYANCDRSTAAPTLSANDFQCFLNAFATQQPYANCDNSAAAPMLNINDFICFMNTYAAGCS